MTNEKSLPSSEREFERGFGWTLLLSFAAHLAIIAALVVSPGFVLRPQPPLKSYTVDLIDPNKLGGTNLVAGSKGKSAGPPKVEPAKAKVPEPPPPPEEAKAEPPPPEPPQPEEKKEPPPPPKPEAAKPPEPPKADEKAVALEKKAAPTPTRPQEVAKVEVPTAAPPEPPTATVKIKPTPVKAEPTKAKPTIAKVQATATAPAKAVAKAAVTPTPAKGAAKTPPQAVAKAQTSPGAKPNTTPAKPGASAVPGKVTPGKGAPAAEGKGPPDAKARDDRIAAAIKRVEEQAGTRGAGSGGGTGNSPGGPISLGPGEGAGGEVRSLATIMYTNRIQAMIKEKWAWAGAKTLKADIGFTIQSDGAVTNVRTVVSSGDTSYDKMAETAVRAASPFPAPPQECQEEFANNGFLYTFEPE